MYTLNVTNSVDGILKEIEVVGLNGLGHLKQFEKTIQKPIYFVLGNHDLYHSSFVEVKKDITSLTFGSPQTVLFNKKVNITGFDGLYFFQVCMEYINFLTKAKQGYLGRPAAKSKSRRWDICSLS